MSDLPDLERIRANFELLDDWEERYAYVIDLGGKLAGLDDALKTEGNRVQGCVSNVWMVSALDGSPPALRFEADSDAHIVRGLIAILMATYSGKTPSEILDVDIRALFSELGLEAHLSPSRSNGFFSMVDRIRRDAQAAAA